MIMFKEELDHLHNEIPRQLDLITDVLRDYEKFGDNDQRKFLFAAIKDIENATGILRLIKVKVVN